jgi:hypothetical protein
MFGTFTFPMIVVLMTGVPEVDQPFNFFFTLMVAMGFIMFVPVAIMKLLGRS